VRWNLIQVLVVQNRNKEHNMPGTILLMDNIKKTLEKWGGLVEELGYQVVKASTLKDAEDVLREKWVHLAILDIRMTVEDDPNDISGLLLAQKPEYAAVPKIILTGHPSFEYVRTALIPDTKGISPVINFISRDDGPQALLDAIEKAFNERVRINWELDIQWEPRERLSFPHLAVLVEAGLSNHLLLQRASELEDLFRKTFFDYQQIRIGRLLWCNSGRFCLPVLARTTRGVTDAHLLVCGDCVRLRQDRETVKEFAPKTIQDLRISGEPVETIHFGALMYELPGTEIESLQTVRDLFRVGRERPLKASFEHLLGDVLKAWHQHGQEVQATGDLMSLYRRWVGLAEKDMPRAEVEQRAEVLVQSVRTLRAVEVENNQGQVTFHFPNRSPLSYPDPIAAFYSPLAKYDQQVVCKVSPGRLNADNVLVDVHQKTWPTDFALAGKAPQWWDYVCLEAAIRFDLGLAPDLLAWQEFEESLAKPTRLDEGPSEDVVPELRTNIALIEQIRRAAASEAGPDTAPYYAGLLAWAVKAMSDYDPEVLHTQADQLKAAHLLLAAAMIAGRLGIETDTSIPEGPLRLDDDGRVWIGERRITKLTGLRLRLLRYLFEHKTQVVSSRTIVEKAYGENYDMQHDPDQRIRQEIRRLREQIEPDPDRPRYILTERERGYRLQTGGENEK
jgi:DNA-binding response OmpR family regulator